MALDELFKTFEFLKKRIEEHREYLSQDETRTRQVLIDPLLKELGWDVGDPSSVELEYQIEKPFRSKGVAKPDYALMQDGKPAAVVEAKRLDSRMLDDATEQVHTYAYNEVIPYGVATDGDEWRLIDVHKRVRPVEKVTTLFKISTDDASACALRSLALWRPNICADGGPVEAVEPVIDDIERIGPVVCPGDEDDESDHTDDSTWTSFAKLTHEGPRPTRIRFNDDAEYEIPSWRRLYTQVAKHLADIGKVNAPFQFEGQSRNAISARRVYDSDPDYIDRVEIGKDLWLERTRTPSQAVSRSKRILEAFGVDIDTVRVRFD